MTALDQAISGIACTPELLVICDFDGVLAPIVAEPSLASPLPEAVAAIESLLTLPRTSVALVSGRALRDLATLARMPSGVRLVGSHGKEFDTGFVAAFKPELVRLREQLQSALEALTKDSPGVHLELKPASIAVHTRNASREIAAEVLDAVKAGPAAWTGIFVTSGKEVIELSVVGADKGEAVDALREQVGASAVVFFGDDVTDEDAFVRLREGDVGVKVGAGATHAEFRVNDPVAAAKALATLSEARAQCPSP